MEKAIPIDTDLGILHGRDCIYLDLAKQDKFDTMTFTGEINGALVSKHKNQKEWFPFKLIFQRVLACYFCELDTYENLAGTSYLDNSNFDWMEDSIWLQALPIRKDYIKDQYTHYRLFTYNVVYPMIAVAYQLEIDR